MIEQAKTSTSIRPLRESELKEADRIFRLAFGTFLGLPDPLTFMGDAGYVRTRLQADPASAFAAEVDGELVGSNFATNWGSVGFFGPVSVRPDLWDRGIGARLVEPAMERFTEWEIEHAGLFTWSHSPKHTISTRSSVSGRAFSPPSCPSRLSRGLW
jgi:predicted N-acetyltransferase YhbS